MHPLTRSSAETISRKSSCTPTIRKLGFGSYLRYNVQCCTLFCPTSIQYIEIHSKIQSYRNHSTIAGSYTMANGYEKRKEGRPSATQCQAHFVALSRQGFPRGHNVGAASLQYSFNDKNIGLFDQLRTTSKQNVSRDRMLSFKVLHLYLMSDISIQ